MKDVPHSSASGSRPRKLAFLAKRRLRLVLILAASVAICAVASHVAVGWLRIKAGNWGGYKRYGPKEKNALAILHCSSTGYAGIDWDQIGEVLGGAIESWATPGSSPSEWELMHDRSSHVARTFVAITAYDLNEYFLCDFRAEIVPLRLGNPRPLAMWRRLAILQKDTKPVPRDANTQALSYRGPV